MILKKYTGLDVGKALLLSDVVIAASTFLIFDVETGLFSILGLVLKSVLVDSVIESLNRRKNFFLIITSTPQVAVRISPITSSGGPLVWEGEGAYTHEKHWVVLAALSGPGGGAAPLSQRARSPGVLDHRQFQRDLRKGLPPGPKGDRLSAIQKPRLMRYA